MPVLNPVRLSRVSRFGIRTVMLWVLVLGLPSALAQDRQQEDLASLYGLRDQGAWQQLLDATSSLPHPDSEHRFLHGLALAQLGRLPEAEAELTKAAEQAGAKAAEILVELAGVQFKEQKWDESTKNLHRAISLGETDPYVFDFLGSLYYLDGNIEAAVKYWNRAGKPNIQELKVEPDGTLNPILLDRVLAVSPSSALDLRSLRLTDLRLEMLGVFARRRYDLSARPDGQFDLTIQTAEKADVRTDSAFRSFLMIARELPFQTLNADVRNIRRSAVNWSSAFRWKFGNHLFATRLSAPFRDNPNLLYSADFTVRDEEWDLSSWSQGGGLTGLKLVEMRAGVTSIAGDRWVWSTGISASRRDLSHGLVPLSSTESSGSALTSTWGTRYDFLQLPERRIKVAGEARGELGRFWSSKASLFGVAELGIDGSWQAQKEDRLVLTARAQTGTSAGSIPFDRLFRLGQDLDSDLLLRGHAGTSDGLKGAGPMGAGYLLSNVDVQKRLYRNAVLSLSVGPFLDSGKVLDPRSSTGRRWMWDPGLEGRLSLFGLFQVALSYGLDTESGNHLIFCRILTR